MLKLFLLLIAIVCGTLVNAQQRIDGNFPFQSDPAKKYSLYIPSGYTGNAPHRMMVALHPFNTQRWDGEAWCDTLIVFAETNNLILMSPDGGADGKIDDPIDTAFTSALMDSMHVWYNIDAQKTYVMGFSWGGKTTYTYGLSHHQKFGGFLPIGAAISGTSEVNVTLQQNASNKAVYIVHGGSDSPNSRFYPVRDSLLSKGAILKDTLMSGVGHTIDFPNRNQILSRAYQWIDSVNCSGSTVGVGYEMPNYTYQVFPNPVKAGKDVQMVLNTEGEAPVEFTFYTVEGKEVLRETFQSKAGDNLWKINTEKLQKGVYLVRMEIRGGGRTTKRIIIE
jgi:predicted esterase